jgi:metacaspase-1
MSSSQNKKALLVGINYKGTQNELNGCINDVNNIKEYLIKDQGFIEANIITLTDDNPNQQPTRDNIVRFLTIGVNQMKSGDLFYFHYSGHGAYIKNNNGTEPDGFDETIIPVDFMTAGQIRDDILRNIINNVPEGAKFVAVMDSCHSEGTFDLRYVYDPITRALAIKKNKKGLTRGKVVIRADTNITTLPAFAETKGKVVILSGCKDNQTSADAYINGRYNGAMTRCLLNVLSQNRGKVAVREIPNQVRSFIIRNYLGDQIPRLTFGRKDISLDETLF